MNITTGGTGCQDTAKLVLTINNSVNTSTPVTSCNSYVWSANGVKYTASGTYMNITTGGTGCQDTAKLVLTINNSVNTSTPVTSCNSYVWSANGVKYTASGTYMNITTGGTGCQDTAKLVLTINNSVNTSTPVTSCNSYVWSANGTTYTASGTYMNITTGATGCQDTAKLVLTINALTTPTFTVVSPICSGATLSALPTTSNNGITGTWSPALDNTATTTYTFTPTVGQCATTTTMMITVAPNANAGTITGASNLCISATSTYTTNGDAGGTWTSSNTGVATVDPASGLVTAMSNGSTTITYTVTGCGSNLVATKSLVVGPPTLMVTSPLTACAPATVDLTAASVTAGSDAGLTFTYHNNPLGTGVFTGGNPAALSSTGTNIYYIRGTATSGCYDVKPVTVTINASITVNAGSDQNICAGTSANLAATSAATGTYSWSVKGNATVIGTAAGVTVTPSATTSYTVTITSGSCSATDEVVVAVKAPTISNSTVISVGPDCVDAQGYTLYTSGANVYFGIKWGALNTGVGKPSEKAKVTITVNGGGAPWMNGNATQAWYVMGRHWDVDLDGSTINASEPVSVRFLFSPAEIAAMMSAAGATTFSGGGAVTVGTPSWFKTNNGTTFVPTGSGTHLTANGLSNSFVINNVNTTPNMWGGLNYAQFDGLTGFSGGTLAVPVNAASILPVTLTRFDAKKVGEQVNVTWKTASEYNSKSFVVEKSTDGVTFKAMTTVAAAGTTKTEHNYGTIDTKPASGDNYYRLLAIDMDGTSRYVGNVIKVNFQGNHSVSVYPNPTANDLTLNINIEEDMQANVNVLDMDGKVIRSFAFDLLEGKNVQTLDVNDLPAGTYMLQTINGSNEVLDLRRFVKIVR
jgi:Secretion system C-terminal sorting domain/Bacterial Ig-like domain (group 2)